MGQISKYSISLIFSHCICLKTRFLIATSTSRELGVQISTFLAYRHEDTQRNCLDHSITYSIVNLRVVSSEHATVYCHILPLFFFLTGTIMKKRIKIHNYISNENTRAVLSIYTVWILSGWSARLSVDLKACRSPWFHHSS